MHLPGHKALLAEVFELTRFVQSSSTCGHLTWELDLFRLVVFFEFIGDVIVRIALYSSLAAVAFQLQRK